MADDDDELTPADLFGMILAQGNHIKRITPQQLAELGVPIDPDWEQDLLIVGFEGQMHGITIAHPSVQMVPVGVSRVLFSGESLATVVALLTLYAQDIVGETSFTSMLDQQIARVRQVKKTEEAKRRNDNNLP